jgi:hypothetical protein
MSAITGFTAGSATLVGKNITFIGNGPNMTTTSFPASNTTVASLLRLSWRTESQTTTVSKRNSNYLNITGTTTPLALTNIQYLDEDTIHITGSQTAAVTVNAFPTTGIKAGQKLIFLNTSASVLTLPTYQGVAPALTQWKTTTAFFTGTEWVYI